MNQPIPAGAWPPAPPPRRLSGWETIYDGPVKGCDGKEVNDG